MFSLTPFQTRYSCKLFDATKKVSEDIIDTLIETARLAPSALGLSVVRCLRIQNSELRTELKKVSLHQPPITDASDLFVLAVKTQFTQRDIDEHITRMALIQQRDEISLQEHKKLIEKVVANFLPEQLIQWFEKQAFITLGFLLTQCSLLGVDACPIGLFDAGRYDEILHLSEQGLHTAIVFTVGYRSTGDIAQTFSKVRIEKEQFFSTKI